MPRIVRLVLALALAAVVPARALAQDLVRGFVDERVVGGFALPVTFAALPDGRLLVAEKAGVVRVVRDGVVLPDAFLDLRASVNDYWDRGLLGLAVDPGFAQNGYVYLFYVREDDPLTSSGPKTARVVRVTAAGDTASLASQVVLVDDIPADSPSHDGGALAFGPDGALWITTGDAASFNTVDPLALRTQQLDSLAGKLLRVGADGRGLPDNPFWNGDANAVRSKVWAYGFRNPFRLTFHPVTSRPYVADVGAAAWEEVNAVAAGGNYGWPCVEGPAPQPGYQAMTECQALYALGAGAVALPLVAYPHTGATASIIGGAFYAGTAFPPMYHGAYFFGDFVQGTLRYVAIDGTDAVTGPIKGFGSGLDGVVDLRADASGLLYLSVTAGELRRIRYVPDTGPDVSRYLSDAESMVTWATSGAGPIELDRSHGTAAAADGDPLTLAGAIFPKGLGVHAPSDIRVALGGMCTAFAVTAGIDDETRGSGTVTFEVWLDGVRVAASGVVRGGAVPLSGALDLTGHHELRLVVTDGGDGPSGDHADWADARLTCTRAGGDTEPPVVVTTTPVAGASGVAIAAPIVATMSEALQPQSVTAASMVVTDPATAVEVPGSVTYDAAARQVVFTPTGALAPGAQYRVTLPAARLRDPAGNALPTPFTWTFTTAAPVTNQLPIANVASPALGATFAVGDVLMFAGSATDAEDGVLPPGALQWTVIVRHCPGGVCHSHPLTSFSGAGGSLVAPAHGADSFLVVTLTATDSHGGAGSVSRELRPRLVAVTLTTDPPGLPVIFGEAARLSPATFQAVVGSVVNVGTLASQHSLTFAGWTSGQPRQHLLTIGTSDLSDRARFTPPVNGHYVSDLTWAAAVNGAGPIERDRSHGGPEASDGGPITLRGHTYAKGMGVLAASDLRVRLGGACTAFAATVGIDDDVQGGGTAVAGVFVDGRLAWVSGLMTGVSTPAPVAVDLTGAAELRLVVVDAGDGSLNDEVDWADARLTCAGPGAAPPAAPAAVSALAAGFTAGVWWAPVPGATSYQLEVGSAPGLGDLGSLELDVNRIDVPAPPGHYWLRVRALNAWGVGAASSDALLVVDGRVNPPEAPASLTASVNGRAVVLRWTPPTSGTLPSEYIIDAGASLDTLGPVARTAALEVAAASVAPGTYVVRVRAATAAGESASGPAITVTVP